MKYIIIWGDIADGHQFIGPFDSPDEASNYCTEDPEIKDSNWSIVLLQEPADILGYIGDSES